MPNDSLAAMIGAALAEHGDAAVLAAWQHFTIPFLPVASVISSYQELANAALENGLTPNDVQDSIALLGSLRTTDDPHRAWVAMEILARNCQNKDLLIAALRANPGKSDARPS